MPGHAAWCDALSGSRAFAKVVRSFHRPVDSCPTQEEVPMKKLLVSLVLALFALSSADAFGQVPEKCKNLTGDAQKKCIDDEKMKK